MTYVFGPSHIFLYKKLNRILKKEGILSYIKHLPNTKNLFYLKNHKLGDSKDFWDLALGVNIGTYTGLTFFQSSSKS